MTNCDKHIALRRSEIKNKRLRNHLYLSVMSVPADVPEHRSCKQIVKNKKTKKLSILEKKKCVGCIFLKIYNI